MSVQSEIKRLKDAVAAAYAAVREKGAALPQERNAQNLAAAIGGVKALRAGMCAGMEGGSGGGFSGGFFEVTPKEAAVDFNEYGDYCIVSATVNIHDGSGGVREFPLNLYADLSGNLS